MFNCQEVTNETQVRQMRAQVVYENGQKAEGLPEVQKLRLGKGGSMNVSKEVKEMLLKEIKNFDNRLFQIGLEFGNLKRMVRDLTVTEPAPAKHEWKVGDFFKTSPFPGNLRQIIDGVDGYYTVIDPHAAQMVHKESTIAELMGLYDYRDAVPATIEEWFAAVRKARGEANQ